MQSTACFLLFFAVFTISPCFSHSGIIKICVLGGSENDTSWSSTIDDIALFIARQHSKAPQIYKHESGDECEFIGSVDRAKMRADFILVVKRENSSVLECDPEWGRRSFAIMNFLPHNGHNGTFTANITFGSSELLDTTEWHAVSTSRQLLRLLAPKFMSPQSRIPWEYPFKAEREERVKRRTLKAIIALMVLVIGALIVLMFLGSLSRFKERKAEKEQESLKRKKLEQKALAPPKTSEREKEAASEKSQKSKKE